MNMFQLSLRYIKKQKKRAVLTIIGIVLSVALVSATGIMVTSFQSMEIEQSKNDYGTWHYQIDGITDEKQVQTLKSNVLIQSAGIAATDTYVKIAGINSKAQSEDYHYLILHEFDASALFMFPYYTINKGRMPQNSNEIVLPTSAANFISEGIKIGDSISLPVGKYAGAGTQNTRSFQQTATRKFTVVGFYNTVKGIYRHEGEGEVLTLNPTGNHNYTVYAQMKSGIDFDTSIHKAVKDCGLTSDKVEIYENMLLQWTGQSKSTGSRDTATGTFLLLATIILAVMVLVIRNSFAMSVSEKISQIGTLRCLGASPKHIHNLVQSEALVIWGIALPIGFLCGLGAMAVVIAAVRSVGVEGLIYLHLAVSAWPFVVTALLSFAAVMLSARIPTGRAMKMPMIEAVRGNTVYRDDRIRKSKKGHFLGKMMGFPGLLAAKNIRRNPKRFRTTVLSVIVSVTLFIAVGGFAIGIGRSISNAISSSAGDYNYETGSGSTQSVSEMDRIERQVKVLSGVDSYQKTLTYYAPLYIPAARVPAKYPSIYKNFTGNTAFDTSQNKTMHRSLMILQVSRGNYNTLHFSGKALTYDELLANKGALLCQTQTLVSGGGRIATVDFANYKPGESITVTQYLSHPAKSSDENTKERKLNVKIAGLLAEKPWYAHDTDGFLVVPQENIGLFGSTTDAKNVELSIKFEKGKEKQTGVKLDELGASAKHISYQNYYEVNKNSRNNMLVTQIFVYGFMSVIILICCVNVFNTINANLLVRKREIAMIRAVGMSQKQLVKMLLTECSLYGLIGTFWGALIGIPLQILLINAFGHVVLADVQSPLQYVLMALLAAVGISILAGLSPIRKMIKAPIIEEIRAQE